ncbi:hypothetical protein GCM10009646_73590 [Streptomyces aureus]
MDGFYDMCHVVSTQPPTLVQAMQGVPPAEGRRFKIRSIHGPSHYNATQSTSFCLVNGQCHVHHQQTKNLLGVPHAWISDTA